jgi:hypothetical protein
VLVVLVLLVAEWWWWLLLPNSVEDVDGFEIQPPVSFLLCGDFTKDSVDFSFGFDLDFCLSSSLLFELITLAEVVGLSAVALLF